MTALPDTSFLCAFYRQQDNSPLAAAHAATMREPLHLTALLLYEFRQSLRLQAWRRAHNPREGMPAADAQAALNQLEADLVNGVAVLVPCDLQEVLRLADAFSARYTIPQGHRAFDILHVAAAQHLGAREFLTFDGNQRRLALAEGLRVKP